MDTDVCEVSPEENPASEAHMIQFEYTLQGRSGFCEGSSVKEGVQAAKADFIYVQWGITARRNLSAFKLRMHSLKGCLFHSICLLQALGITQSCKSKPTRALYQPKTNQPWPHIVVL